MPLAGSAWKVGMGMGFDGVEMSTTYIICRLSGQPFPPDKPVVPDEGVHRISCRIAEVEDLRHPIGAPIRELLRGGVFQVLAVAHEVGDAGVAFPETLVGVR